MKKIFTLLFVLFSVYSFSATRTISIAGGNFNSTLSWDEGAVPVAGDAVVARGDGLSGNLTVNVASGGVGLLSVDFTNYTGTLTMSNTLTVAGNVTTVGGMTITGTSNLILAGTGTITSNGNTWSGGLQTINGSKTYTLSDNMSIVGTYTLTGGGATAWNGNSLNIGGGYLNNGFRTGTTKIVLNGTGTWSSTVDNVNTESNLEINTSGTITISGKVYCYGTFLYTTGTVVTTGSTFYVVNNTTTVTINNSGLIFNNFTWGTALSLTFNGSNGCSFSGLFSRVGGLNTCTWQAGNTYIINSTGGLTLTGTLGSNITFKSSSTSTRAIVTLTAGASQSVSYTNGQYIDSSGGETVMNNKGTLAGTINWNRTPMSGAAIFFQQW